MELAALKAMREHKPVYCFRRRYEIISTKQTSYYLVFIIKTGWCWFNAEKND